MCGQGSFNINPYYCRRMRVDNIQICKLECPLSLSVAARVTDLAVADNPWSSPNTDGLDPSHCTDVSFTNSLIATGDDCIAIKAGYKQ